MRALSESTVAQFVFVQTPDIAFADLVDELGQALDRAGSGDHQTHWVTDALVLMDIVGLRFALALYTHPTDPDACCLTLSVGPADQPCDLETAPFDPAEMCQLLARRLEAVLLPDMTFWHRVEGPVDPETIDRLICSLPEVGAMRSIGAFRARPRQAIAATPTAEGDKAVIEALLAELHAATAEAAPETPRPAAPEEAPADMQAGTLADTLAEAELIPTPLQASTAPCPQDEADLPAAHTASQDPAPEDETAVILPLERSARPSAPAMPPRRAVRPGRPVAPAPAKAVSPAATPAAPVAPPVATGRARLAANRAQAPDPAPHSFGSVEEMARLRSALYPPDETTGETNAPEAKRLRLAAHTMDATLLVVAPPVGAAIMAYGALRGGDLIRSGRTMALTCTVVALMQSQGLGFV
jgi:hypothetical protein